MDNQPKISCGVIFGFLLATLLSLLGCGGHPSAVVGSRGGASGTGGSAACTLGPAPDLVINEISSNNDGNAVDEFGNADDWVELVNRGSTPASLEGLTIVAGDKVADLPKETIAPGARVLFWTDGTLKQGPHHLSLKLRASGGRLSLRHCNRVIASVDIPALDTDVVLARFPDTEGDLIRCRYATPNRNNGATCGPPTPTPLITDFHYSDFAWTLPHPALPSPLAIDELALNPAQFVELRNVSETSVDLSNYQLRLAGIRPGAPWPTATDGTSLPLDVTRTLLPGERIVVPVTTSDVSSVAAQPPFEGVVTLFSSDATAADRVDFARWPEHAVLARTPRYPGHHIFCTPATPGASNETCTVMNQRDVGDYVRHIRTLADFEALAAGSGELGMASVKFILDMDAGDQIYLVGARDWSLHYEFVREMLYHQSHLDRCDPMQRDAFDNGWYLFSVSEYFQTTGRRFLLGTLVHHAAADLYTVEFTGGDAILPQDMRKAFFAATSHTFAPEAFHLRPQDEDQRAYAQQLDGTLPIVDTNAPFASVKLQPLTAAVGYGVLQYIPVSELASASLGPDVIVITDDVPNDIRLLGGLVTEAFQTPLSHVNVLCQNRGTPNLALPLAHLHPDFAPYVGQLVRFEVTSSGYRVAPAAAEEAQTFWNANRPSQTLLTPRLDVDRTGIVDLQHASLADLPSIGAKAAQLAELAQLIKSYRPTCTTATGFKIPDPVVAIPMSYFLAHARASGARGLLETLIADADATANRSTRHERLDAIRRAIRTTPIEPQTLSELTQLLRDRFGSTRVRMRSSSNAEDLPGFNGAGLYSSTSASVDDPDHPLDDALREVWASLYSDRGYDERVQRNVDQLQIGMAVLVHPAFPEERANGVVISRNIDDLTRGDQYTFNVQLGEASVTNPAPGVTSDQFTYQWPPRTPATSMKSTSTFNGGQPVLSEHEIVSLACALRAIVTHFRPLLDPTGSDAYFTMDMEVKVLGDERQLLVKQARPYTFGSWQNPGDCREF